MRRLLEGRATWLDEMNKLNVIVTIGHSSCRHRRRPRLGRRRRLPGRRHQTWNQANLKDGRRQTHMAE